MFTARILCAIQLEMVRPAERIFTRSIVVHRICSKFFFLALFVVKHVVVVVVVVVVNVVGLEAKSVVQFVIPCFGIIFFPLWRGDCSFVPFFFCYKFFVDRCRCQHGRASTLSLAQIGWRHFIPLSSFSSSAFFFIFTLQV